MPPQIAHVIHSKRSKCEVHQIYFKKFSVFALGKMFVYGFWLLWHLATREISASILTVFLGVLVFVRLLQIVREARSLPPGPWGLPIVGSLPFLKGDLHLHYRDLTKKYGSLFSTRLGSQLIVVLSDYKIIRDAFRKEEFTGRPTTDVINTLEGYGKSLKTFFGEQSLISIYELHENFHTSYHLYQYKILIFSPIALQLSFFNFVNNRRLSNIGREDAYIFF